MWLLWLAGGYVIGKYGRRLLDASIHGEYKIIAFVVSDNGPNVDGPSYRSKRVTLPAPVTGSRGMAELYQAAKKVADEWYPGNSRVEQAAGGPYSGPFSVTTPQGEWWLYVESVSQ